MIHEKIISFKNFLKINPLVPKFKDKAILAGWIGGLLLMAAFSWFLTQPIRNNFLLRAVNRVLEQDGDERRLGEVVSFNDGSRMGVYYSLNNSSALGNAGRVFIFTFFTGGTFFPCAAIMGAGGTVEEFIALNRQGRKILEGISPVILNLYSRRIEGSR